MTSRPSTTGPILSMLAILLVTLGTYVGGYFWLGKRIDSLSLSPRTQIEAIDRSYAHVWLATTYRPAGWVKSMLRRDVVITPPFYRGSSIGGAKKLPQVT